MCLGSLRRRDLTVAVTDLPFVLLDTKSHWHCE